MEHSRKEKREELAESAKDFAQRYHSLFTSVKTYVSNMQDSILVCILTNLNFDLLLVDNVRTVGLIVFLLDLMCTPFPTVLPKRSEEELPDSQITVQQTHAESTAVEITGKLQLY